MTPEEALTQRLTAEITAEFEKLHRLKEEFAGTPRDEISVVIRGRGLILHDFYSGVERIFRRIAEELDGGVPQGERWHRQLLDNMSLGITEVRPPVITPDLAKRLREFLKFRHVLRNAYGYELDPCLLVPLEECLPETLDAFEEQVRTFLAWLTGTEGRDRESDPDSN